MKKIILLSAILLLTAVAAWSQNETLPDAPVVSIGSKQDSVIFERVEIEASFPGGTDAWRKYLQQNLNASTPVDFGAPAGKYTVSIQFIVDINGKLSDFKALTKHGYGMEKEVIRILKNSPTWLPAQQDGRKVKAYRVQPVTFMVTEGKKKRNRNY